MARVESLPRAAFATTYLPVGEQGQLLAWPGIILGGKLERDANSDDKGKIGDDDRQHAAGESVLLRLPSLETLSPTRTFQNGANDITERTPNTGELRGQEQINEFEYGS